MSSPENIVLTHRLRFKIVALSLLAFCTVVASIIYFTLSIGNPSMGVVLSWDDRGWVIKELDSNGLAIHSGIKVGDRPIIIEGQPAQYFLKEYAKENTAFSTLISDITVIDSNGKLKSASIKNSPPLQSSLIEQATSFVICLIFWIVGLFVFFKRPRNQAALLLLMCSLTSGIALTANSAAERIIPGAFILAVISTIIGPWLLVHFFLSLPEERNLLNKNLLIYIIYLPALVTIILFPFIGYAEGQPLPDFHNFRLIEYGTGFATAVSIMIFNYVRATSQRTRQQMKLILISCAMAFIPILILVLIPGTIWKQFIIPFGFSILFLIFIPFGMGYTVVTQRLLDIDVIIRRSVIYALITVLMAMILSAAIFPILALRVSLGIPQEILLALVLGGVATAIFGPMKKSIEYLIDKFFYKDRYDYRKIIQSFSGSLNSFKEFNEIARLIVGTPVNTLNLSGGCLLGRSESNKRDFSFDIRAAQGILTDSDKQIQLMHLLQNRDRKFEFPDAAPVENTDIAYIIPLVAGDREVGILFLSPKVSRQNFSSDDVYLLQGLASVAAAALRSAMLTHDVSLRDTFVSIASHELRTSLTPIMGYASLLLKEGRSKEVQKRWLENIYANGERITSMVDDLLNVSRIQTGRVSMKIEKVKILDVLKKQMDMTQEGTKIHKLVLELEPELPEVLVDKDKFGQVIWNLLSNAVKYSPDGGCIRVAAHMDRPKSRMIITIADQGIGISPQDKDYLFKTFHRIDRPETRGIRGSGLGLYIVKEWTEAMEGEIWLESVLNKGSTFFVAVPISDSG
jgi:signal transduction histidine kinase